MIINSENDVLQRIKRLPAGLMELAVIEKGNSKEIAYFVKEDTRYIKKIDKYRPCVDINCTIYSTDIVSNFLVMVNVERNNDMLYDAWINSCSPDGMELCQMLAEQNTIQIRFVNEFGTIAKMIEVKNALKEQMKRYIEITETKGPWWMGEFDFVKEFIYKKYPTGTSLWSSLRLNEKEVIITGEELKQAGKKGSIKVDKIFFI